MGAPRVAVIAILTLVSSAYAEDAFSVARKQAKPLGQVLGGIQACEGDAWEAHFLEFMAAKRKRGLNGEQTAMIATLVGAAQSLADRDTLECSSDEQAKRAAAIDAMRAEW
jgi:hypothetical protein